MEERSLTPISLSIDIARGNVCSKYVSRHFALNTFRVVEKELNRVHHCLHNRCKYSSLIFDLYAEQKLPESATWHRRPIELFLLLQVLSLRIVHSNRPNSANIHECIFFSMTYIAIYFNCNISNTSDGVSSGYPNTEKRVENTTRSGVFLTKFEVFG